MKLAAALTLVSAALAVDAASLPVKRQISCSDSKRLLTQNDSPWTFPLVEQCQNVLQNHAGFVNPWANRVCVAAAVTASPGLLRDVLSCVATDIPLLADLPSMPFSVYESITGSTNDKVFIDQQNLIDLVYSSIQTESSPVWPINVQDVIQYIALIFDFVGESTDRTIPYSHFSDWLKFAPQEVIPSFVSSPLPTSTIAAATTVAAGQTTVTVAAQPSGLVPILGGNTEAPVASHAA